MYTLKLNYEQLKIVLLGASCVLSKPGREGETIANSIQIVRGIISSNALKDLPRDLEDGIREGMKRFNWVSKEQDIIVIKDEGGENV